MEKLNEFQKRYTNYLKDNVFYIIIVAVILFISRDIAFYSIQFGTAGSAYALNAWIVGTLRTISFIVEFTALFPLIMILCELVITKYLDYRANEKPLEPKNDVAKAKLADEPWNTKLVTSEPAGETTTVASSTESNKRNIYVETLLPPVMRPKHKAVVFYGGQYKELIARKGDLAIFVPGNELSEKSLNSLINSDYTDIDLVIKKDKSADLPDYDKLRLANKNVKIYVHF